MDNISFLDVEKIRQNFPILSREISPVVPLIYLDSAATSQSRIQCESPSWHTPPG